VEIAVTPASEPVTDTVERQVCAPRSSLLQAGTALLELAALVVDVISVTDECTRRGHSNVGIDVAVHAKHSRMLGFLRAIGVDCPFHRGVEGVGFAVVVDGTGRKQVLAVQQVFAVWCAVRVVGRVVVDCVFGLALAGDAAGCTITGILDTAGYQEASHVSRL
jgi:hypothetical protein